MAKRCWGSHCRSVSTALVIVLTQEYVLMGRYYILRDEMLADLTRLAGEQVQSNAPWQVSYTLTEEQEGHTELTLMVRTLKLHYTVYDIHPRLSHWARIKAFLYYLAIKSWVAWLIAQYPVKEKKGSVLLSCALSVSLPSSLVGR